MLNKMIMLETTASDIKQENNLKCIFYKRFEYSEVFVIFFQDIKNTKFQINFGPVT